jgi:hypothetical protein
VNPPMGRDTRTRRSCATARGRVGVRSRGRRGRGPHCEFSLRGLSPQDPWVLRRRPGIPQCELPVLASRHFSCFVVDDLRSPEPPAQVLRTRDMHLSPLSFWRNLRVVNVLPSAVDVQSLQSSRMSWCNGFELVGGGGGSDWVERAHLPRVLLVMGCVARDGRGRHRVRASGVISSA